MNEGAPREEGRAGGKLASRIAAATILAFAAVVFYDAINVTGRGGFGPQQPGFFPMIVAVGLAVFGLAFLLRTTFWPDRDLMDQVAEAQAETHWFTVGLVAAALLLYAFILGALGYIVSTALFFVTVARIAGSRRPLRDVVVGVALSVVVYFGFTELLGVRLPAGVLEPIL